MSIKPRLKSSKALTILPESFQKQVTELLKTHFSEHSKKGYFKVDGVISKNEIVFRYSYQPQDSIKTIQFDLSLEYNSSRSDFKDDPLMKVFEVLSDLGASLFHSLFEDQDFELPSLWSPIEFENHTIYIQSEGIHSQLESQADEILGLSSKSNDLVQGDMESEDIEKIIHTLSAKKNSESPK